MMVLFRMFDYMHYYCYHHHHHHHYHHHHHHHYLQLQHFLRMNSQEMRISSWVTPVYARLQRRFVRFLANAAEEKEEEINAEAFQRLLSRIKFDVYPRYSLSGVSIPRPTSERPSSTYTESDLNGSNPSSATGDSTGNVVMSSVDLEYYPAWELANFVTKVIN